MLERRSNEGEEGVEGEKGGKGGREGGREANRFLMINNISPYGVN